MMLTPREVVLQSQIIHPEWDVDDHLAFLDDECYFSTDPADIDAARPLVAKWMREHKAGDVRVTVFD